MIKWFVYIAILWILMPCLTLANANRAGRHFDVFSNHYTLRSRFDSVEKAVADTTPNKSRQQKQQEADDKKKVKEVAKAKHVPKPEKVDDGNADQKPKPRRQRRPPGMERPPEIPRHNGN